MYLDDNFVTVCICNFNTRRLCINALKTFNAFHQKSKYNYQFIIVDNSSKEECFKLNDVPDDFKYPVQIVDNTKQQVFKYVNNSADYRHSRNVQYAIDICNTKKFVLCDSDVFFKKSIDCLIDNCKLVSAGICRNTDPRGQRFLPFLQIFNIEKMRKYNLKFLDDNFDQPDYKYKFLLIHKKTIFTGVILTYQILKEHSEEFINFQISNYICHLSHGNILLKDDIDKFINEAEDYLIQANQLNSKNS